MSYTVTVHVDSGRPGSNGNSIGHAYYEVSNGTNSYFYGLYPESTSAMIFGGVVGEVSGRVLDTDGITRVQGISSASETYDLSQEQFENLKTWSDSAKVNPPSYDLNGYNCTHFVRD